MSLEDIDLVFRESPSVLKTVSYARTKPRRVTDDETAVGAEKHGSEHEEKV